MGITSRNRSKSVLELPEIISGLLALFVVLWMACFEPFAVDAIARSHFLKETNLVLCGLVTFNTLSVFVHLVMEAVRRGGWPGAFLWWQFVVGSLATMLFFGGLFHYLPPWVYYVSFGFSFIVGIFSVVNIIAKWAEFRACRKMGRKMAYWSPAAIFFASMLAFVLVSSIILMTPGATRTELTFIEALFTCASATTITGLVCIDVGATLAPIGKIVVLLDMQVGAIGVMTFTYQIMLMMGKKITVRDSSSMSAIYDQESTSAVGPLLKAVLFVTFFVEAVGATCLYFLWQDVPGIPQQHLWFYAIFHAVAAFCNSGIALFPDNMAHAAVVHDTPVQMLMMMLMFAGTLSFGVYLECMRRAKNRILGKRNPVRWSTSTWLILRVTGIVLASGVLGLTLISWLEPSTHAQCGEINLWESLWNSIGRSAGFNISDISTYGPVYHLYVCMLMFVGGNPASTGGGVFAPVFALCMLEILRVLRGQHDLVLHGRRIMRSTVERAMATVVLSVVWIAFSAMLLMLLEPAMATSANGVVELLFLEVSAYTTTGYSICDPADLGDASKLLIIVNMLFGRVGMFTFMLIFIPRRDPSPIRYPEVRLPIT